jgi:hypothetical protein
MIGQTQGHLIPQFRGQVIGQSQGRVIPHPPVGIYPPRAIT